MAPVAASLAPVVDPIASITPTTAAKDKAAARKRFEAVYSVVRDDLLTDFRKHNMPEESIDYYRRVRSRRIYASHALVGLTNSFSKCRVWITTSQAENLTAV
jgi:hypothetical protein